MENIKIQIITLIITVFIYNIIKILILQMNTLIIKTYIIQV